MFRKANLQNFKKEYDELLDREEIKDLMAAKEKFEKAESEEEIIDSQMQLNEISQTFKKNKWQDKLKGIVKFAEAVKDEYDRSVSEAIKQRGKKSPSSGGASPVFTKRTTPSVSRKNSASTSNSNSTSTSPNLSRKNSLSNVFESSSEVNTSFSDANESGLEASSMPASPRLSSKSSFSDSTEIDLEESLQLLPRRRVSFGDEGTSSGEKVLHEEEQLQSVPLLLELNEKKLMIFKAFRAEMALDYKTMALYNRHPYVEAMSNLIGAVYWFKNRWQKDQESLVHEQMLKSISAEGEQLIKNAKNRSASVTAGDVEKYLAKLEAFIAKEKDKEIEKEKKNKGKKKTKERQLYRLQTLQEEDSLSGLRKLQTRLLELNIPQVSVNQSKEVDINKSVKENENKRILSKSNSQVFTKARILGGFFKTSSNRNLSVRKDAPPSLPKEKPKLKG